ncbi:MAG TPA: ribosomal protein L7/L12 [Fimbriiglobus sp.]|jgi:ribosomal protein L7/L12
MNVNWSFVACVAALLAYTLIFQLLSKVGQLQRQMNLILKQLGIDPTKTPEISDRVKEIATDPSRKIEAIKLVRDETGVGLAEAKRIVEGITQNSNN